MNKAFFNYISVLLLFGSNGIVAGYIDLSSYEIVFLRTMIGSIFLITLFFLRGKKFTFPRHKKDFVFISISGIATGIGWVFLYEAYGQIGVGVASLCYYCGPIIVMLFSPLLFKEKLTCTKIVGFVVVLIGLFLVNCCETVGTNYFGVLCGIVSAIMYAFMVIFNKKAVLVTGLENSALQLFSAFVTVAFFVGLKQGFVIDISKESILPIFILGLLNTGVGCCVYFSSMSKLPVQTVAICGYVEPLSAVLFSAIFCGERLLAHQIIGVFLIVGGAILGERIKIKRKMPMQ